MGGHIANLWFYHTDLRLKINVMQNSDSSEERAPGTIEL